MKNYSKTVKFDYLVPVKVTKNSIRDEKFDLYECISEIDKIGIEDRLKEYYGENVKIDKLIYRADKDYWFISFVRMREIGIPELAYKNKESKPMELSEDEYLGESANAIYHVATNILMLQRNRYSLGMSGIEEYLNHFKVNYEYEIRLRPIIKHDVLQKLKKSKTVIKSICVKFAEMQRNIVLNHKPRSLLQYHSNINEFNAFGATIEYTVGRHQKEELNKEMVLDSINDVLENRELVSEAILKIKEDEEPVEILPILNCNIKESIKFKIPKRTSLSSEYAEQEMYEAFNKRKGELINELYGKD